MPQVAQCLGNCSRIGSLGRFGHTFAIGVKLGANLFGRLLLSLSLANLANGLLYARVGRGQNLLGLGFGLMQYGVALRFEVVGFIFVEREELVELTLFLLDILALVGPIAAVAGYIEQILVEVYVVTAHNLLRLGNDIAVKADLACDLHGKRAARITHRQLEGRLKMLPVVEHRAIDEALCLAGKGLEVLIVGGDYTQTACAREFLENRLCQRATYLRLGARTHLISQYQSLLRGVLQEEFHVAQMRRVGREVILYRLLVAYINIYITEYPHMRVLIHCGEHAALHHVLHHTHSLQTHRLTTGIRTGDYQYALGVVESERKWHDLLTLRPEGQEQLRMHGMIPFDDPLTLKIRHTAINFACKESLGADEIEPGKHPA